MPRRQEREVPRWRRGPQPPRTGGLLRTHTREATPATCDTTPPPSPAARIGAWRFRNHTQPWAWLAALLIAGFVLHASPHPFLWGLLASIIAPLAMTAATRQRRSTGDYRISRYARRFTDVEAAATSFWLPVLATAGPLACMPLLLATWAPFAALWTRHYRWRPQPQPQPGPEEETTPSTDAATWDDLAGTRKWHATLGPRENIPGGRKYPIVLVGAKTHIGQLMTEPRAVAAAYDKPQTEAYVEPHPAGIESKGFLTILNGGTLEAVSDWDGRGFSEDGIARIGRFADGQPARIRAWVPQDGTRHGLVAGASGAGKSQLLSLLVWLALKGPVPVVPVILDPQNGQSLPQWRDKVLYAAGIDECARMVRGLKAGMEDRSTRLSSMTWDDDGHTVKGMEFFDARLTGLPIFMPIIDEAHMLLSGDGNSKLGQEMVRLIGVAAKLGRKTGGSEWLVTQVPSLTELGDQALRSMLVGGNVVCLRTGDRVSAGMLGLEADPSVLPKYFPDGEQPTAGLGYLVSVDNRQAPFRSDRVPRAMRHQPAEVPALEPEFLEAMDKAMGGVSPTATLPVLSQAPEPADDAPQGRRCIDAVWKVLTGNGGDMDRGQILEQVIRIAGEWDRKPWTIRQVSNALRDLADGKIPAREPGWTVTKPQGPEGGRFRAVPPSREGPAGEEAAS